jgi:hypothetical protein
MRADRFEFAAIDGYARLRKQIPPAAQHHKLTANIAYRLAVVSSEVGNRLEVG